MPRIGTLFSCIMLLAAASCAAAQTTLPDQQPITVSLQADENSDKSQPPYRSASLLVRYDPGAAKEPNDVIRAITIRSISGGPTMLIGVTIPARAPGQNISVLVPAMSAHDSYKVRFLSGPTADSPLIAQFDLTVDWPAELVASEPFIDPQAYDDGEYMPPVWSSRTLQTVFAGVLAACVMLGSCLLIRKTSLRLAAATGILVLAAGCLWLIANLEPVIAQRQVGEDSRLLLVTSMRDARCEIPEPYTIPLYYNTEEMAADRAVVAAPGKLIVDMKAGQVRLFAKPPQDGSDI